MTILIGYRGLDMVTIIGDTKSTHVDVSKNNESQGTYDSIHKVFPISENMLIGIAGLNDLGLGIKTLLHSVFSLKHSLTVVEMIKYVESTCVYAHEMYKKVNPKKNADLLIMVAAMDGKINKSYLYELSSQDSFIPKELTGNMTIQGPEKEKVRNYIYNPSQPHNISNFDDLIKVFSGAIRLVDHEYVSKDTYSFILTYNNRFGYQAYIRSINAKGNMKYLDLAGNEIPK